MPPTDLKQRIFLAAVTALGLEACSADEPEPITAEPAEAPNTSTAGTETPMAPPPAEPEAQAEDRLEAEAELDDEPPGGSDPTGRVPRPRRPTIGEIERPDSVIEQPSQRASCGASCGAECGGTPADDE